MSRNVTDESERFQILRLCDCTTCGGTGRQKGNPRPFHKWRCPVCRGEGRTRQLVATCATPEAVGVALVTLGRD